MATSIKTLNKPKNHIKMDFKRQNQLAALKAAQAAAAGGLNYAIYKHGLQESPQVGGPLTRPRFAMKRRYGSKITFGKRRRSRRTMRGIYRRKHRRFAIRRIRPEIHSRSDTSLTTQGVGLYSTNGVNSGHQLLLTAATGRSFTPRIPQGDDNTERAGWSVQMKTLWCRFRFTTQANYVGPMTVRIFVFSKKNDTTIGTLVSDLFDFDPLISPGNIVISPMSNRNKAKYNDYIVYKDMTIFIPEDGSAGTFPLTVDRSFAIPLKGKVLKYNPGQTTSLTGDLGCVVSCTAGSTVDLNALSMLWETKLHYIDV